VLVGEHLRRSFRRKVAVKDVSLRVMPGEIVGLLGPNGAGKTTTFEMLVGFLQPNSGRVLLDGTDITPLPVWKRARLGISYLPQEISLFQKLTVEENLLIVLESRMSSRDGIRQVCGDLLRQMGLAGMAKQVAGTLSGGEKRRLEVARSLINRPRFFLLDEPFSGIDPKTVTEIQEMVVSLQKDGIGILITDHNVRDALRITHRAYLIADGEILVEGTPREFLEHPESRSGYFGEKFEL